MIATGTFLPVSIGEYLVFLSGKAPLPDANGRFAPEMLDGSAASLGSGRLGEPAPP